MKNEKRTSFILALTCFCLLFLGNTRVNAQPNIGPIIGPIIVILTAQGCCYRVAGGQVASIIPDVTPLECAGYSGGPGFEYQWAANPCPYTEGQVIGLGLVTLGIDKGNSTAVGIHEKLLKVFPNPFDRNIRIDYQAKQNEQVWVQLFDLMGRQIYSQEFNLSTGFNSIQMDLNQNLNHGTYLLQVRDGEGEMFTKKIMKY